MTEQSVETCVWPKLVGTIKQRKTGKEFKRYYCSEIKCYFYGDCCANCPKYKDKRKKSV